MLSDYDIRYALSTGQLSILPYPEPEALQPVSVDLRLSNHFRRQTGPAIYVDRTWIAPQEFLLASTREVVKLGASLAGVVAGKSTLARKGLMVEAAGLVDPGFEGQLTLELFNMGSRPLALSAGMSICQIYFHKTDNEALRVYGSPGLNSHYQGQTGATGAYGQ